MASNFKDLCKKCLDDIVSSDDLNADEVSVYTALMNWSKGECSRKKIPPSDENKRKVLGDTLFHVRFCLMDVTDFTKYVSKKNVLTPEEKISLYQYFHGETDKLPTKFHHSKLRRFGKTKQKDDRGEQVTYQNYVAKEPDSWPQQKAFSLQKPLKEFSTKSSRESTFHLMRRVLRFSGVDGSWQVKNPDAISFWVSLPINLHGVQVYGPVKQNTAYNVVVTVYDDLKEVIREDSRTVTINRKDVYDVLLSEPVRVPEERLFTVETRMKGDQPTQRGIGGVKTISAEGVMFNFVDSSKSLNGTDITTGQIPALLFNTTY